jgi:anti-sigma B factor antagonist
MELSLATRTVADHAVVEVGGEVDVYTAPRLRERLVELIDGGARDVVVDLGRVDFLDSTGLGVLVGALKRLRAAGGTFSLVCAKEPLLKVFRITALDQVFPLHDTVESATGIRPDGTREGSRASGAGQGHDEANRAEGHGDSAGPAR